MNRSLMTGIAIGGILAVTGGAIAGYNALNRGPDYAQVLSAKPVTETIRTPREECYDVAVPQADTPTRDPRRITGTAIGAVIGGVIGNQIGDGDGKKIATAAGAAAGGYAGNRVQKRIQDRNATTGAPVTERKCDTVYDTSEKRMGYDVKYRLGDQEGTVRMDHDPGPRIPVKDGELLLEQQTG